MCSLWLPEPFSLSPRDAPKRLIKTEPKPAFTKNLLRLKTFMHTHTHAYFVITGAESTGRGQMPG